MRKLIFTIFAFVLPFVFTSVVFAHEGEAEITDVAASDWLSPVIAAAIIVASIVIAMIIRRSKIIRS